MNYHLVMTQSGLLLVKRPGADWRALAAEFEGYKNSVGPRDLTFMQSFIGHEWPEIALAHSAAISAFAASEETVLALGG